MFNEFPTRSLKALISFVGTPSLLSPTSPPPAISDFSIRTNHGSSSAPFEPGFCTPLTWLFKEINQCIIFQGLPLHVQIDTFEETKDTGPVHRGYCQVKVFCDKVGVLYILCSIYYNCTIKLWDIIMVLVKHGQNH